MVRKVYTTQEIKELLKKTLDKTPVKRAILFGSYAKGLADEDSDIDLLIDSEGEIVGLEFYSVRYAIEKKIKKEVDLIEQKEVIPGGRIEKEIKESGVLIYEKRDNSNRKNA